MSCNCRPPTSPPVGGDLCFLCGVDPVTGVPLFPTNLVGTITVSVQGSIEAIGCDAIFLNNDEFAVGCERARCALHISIGTTLHASFDTGEHSLRSSSHLRRETRDDEPLRVVTDAR